MTNRMFAESKGYATVENATKKLTTELGFLGLKLEDVRWLVAVNDEGKYVPAVLVNLNAPGAQALIGLAHRGIGVLG